MSVYREAAVVVDEPKCKPRWRIVKKSEKDINNSLYLKYQVQKRYWFFWLNEKCFTSKDRAINWVISKIEFEENKNTALPPAVVVWRDTD